MRIISNFKDYYDFAGNSARSGDYREVVYLRKTSLGIAEVELCSVEITRNNRWDTAHEGKIISKWWDKNKKTFLLPNMPSTVRSGCLFVCGKAYPFLFLRDAAVIGADGKSGQIKFSTLFNGIIKNGLERKKEKPAWEREKQYEDEFNFFKPYYSWKEFNEDVRLEQVQCRYQPWKWDIGLNENLRKDFFSFYDGKDFTELHLRLDCPLFLTLFHSAEAKHGDDKHKYEFVLNPNLYELDFIRVMNGEILVQELDMFLGNILVKDAMPPSRQSDLDKLTAHGFDPRTSFRNTKPKK